MSAEIVRLHEDDGLPRAMQDAETLRLLGDKGQRVPMAREVGERRHPNGVVEFYAREEF